MSEPETSEATPAPAIVDDTPRTPGPTRACLAVSLAGFAGIVAYVLGVNPPLWWDEVWYLNYVNELHQFGLSAAWLNAIDGPAGPLVGLVQAVFEPLTGLRPPGVRVVSMAMAVLTVLGLGLAMRARRIDSPFAKAACLLAIPLLSNSIGTAITEMPAMAFFCSGLAALIAALDRLARGERGSELLAALGGLAVGVATTGRQPFLIVTLSSVVLLRPGTWRVGLPFLACALAVPAPCFLVWRGVMPPIAQGFEVGTSLPNGLTAFAYAGVIYCLFDVRWILRRPWAFAGVLALTTAVNAATGAVEHYPLHMTAMMYLSPKALHAYGLLTSGVMLGFGAAFIVELARLAWGFRRDPAGLFMVVATTLLLAATIKNARMFAGRYIATVVPMLMIFAGERTPDTYGKAARLALGCILGLISLRATFLVSQS